VQMPAHINFFYAYRNDLIALALVLSTLVMTAIAGETPTSPSNTIRALPAALGITECTASGKGHDYQVGGNEPGHLPELDDVPWERLSSGDTVRLSYRNSPYKGKILITGEGKPDAPIRICGIRGPNNERPVIDGDGATTRSVLETLYASQAYSPLFQKRAVVLVKADIAHGNAWTNYPKHIQIDGLQIRGATPNHTFTMASGAKSQYESFGACIWIDRGKYILIADNEINDCTNGIFAKSTSDGDFSVTANIKIAGNYVHDNGVVGDEHQHNSYVESKSVIYEFNHYGPLHHGALGNAIKDRSIGTIVRYNRLEEGAHSIDLVEAEDFAQTATNDPEYRAAFVYGNQIIKNGDTGSFIHYGGDHYGSNKATMNSGATWGEPEFRKGTLYFYNNTVIAHGKSPRIFQLSTTEESADVWNNIILLDSDGFFDKLNLRTTTQGLGPYWVAGGTMRLGVNWISPGWSDSDRFHPIPGPITGSSNVISTKVLPISLQTLIPLPGSAVIGAGKGGPDAVKQYPVTAQLDRQLRPTDRPADIKNAIDLGAVGSVQANSK